MENKKWYLIPIVADGVYIDGVSLKEYFNLPNVLIALERVKTNILFDNLHDENEYYSYESYASVMYRKFGYPEYLVGYCIDNGNINLLHMNVSIESSYNNPAFYSTRISMEDVADYIEDTDYYLKLYNLINSDSLKKVRKK